MNHTHVIRGASRVDLGRNAQAAPEGAGNTTEGLTDNDYEGVDVAGIQRTQNPAPTAKIAVRKITCPDHGRVWRVTYPCGCGRRQFRQFHVALIFATSHHCPEPWEPLPTRRRTGWGWK